MMHCFLYRCSTEKDVFLSFQRDDIYQAQTKKLSTPGIIYRYDDQTSSLSLLPSGLTTVSPIPSVGRSCRR
jgi:hypothetical protein